MRSDELIDQSPGKGRRGRQMYTLFIEFQNGVTTSIVFATREQAELQEIFLLDTMSDIKITQIMRMQHDQ
jgi:hypothetical protein